MAEFTDDDLPSSLPGTTAMPSLPQLTLRSPAGNDQQRDDL